MKKKKKKRKKRGWLRNIEKATFRSGGAQVSPAAVTSDLLSVCKIGARVRVLFVFGLQSEAKGTKKKKGMEKEKRSPSISER